MKLNRIWLAALALPFVAAAQVAPAKAKIDPKTSLAVINANIAKITYAPEKERWQANAAAWQIVLAHPGALDKTQLDETRSDLGMICFNLSKVRDAGEKQRWQANVDLWHLLMANDGVFTKSDIVKAKALIDKITMNLARVDDAGETERWQANLDIWKAMLDRAKAIA